MPLPRTCPCFPKLFSHSPAFSPSQRFSFSFSLLSSKSFFLPSLQILVASPSAHLRFISQAAIAQFAQLSSFELMTPAIPSRTYSRKKNAAGSRREEATGGNVERAEWPVRAAEEQQDSDINIEGVSLSKHASRNAVEERTNKDDVPRKNGKDPEGASKDVSDRTSVEEELTNTVQDLQLLEHIGSLGEEEFHEWLTTEDQRTGFGTLAATSLQRILVRIGRQSTGCKQELIMEIQKFLAEHQREDLLEDNESLIPRIEVVKECTYKRKQRHTGKHSMLSTIHLTDTNEKNHIIAGECGHLDGAGEVIPPPKLFPQRENQMILLELDVGLLQEDVNGKEIGKTHQNVLLTDTDVDKSKKVEIVYTRRSKRKSMAKQIPIVEDSQHMLDNSPENSSKKPEISSYDSLLSSQHGENNTTVSEPITLPKKLRLVVKGPRPPETEVLIASKTQEIEVSVMKENPWTVLVHKKVQPGWIAYNPATMRPRPLDTGMLSLKLLSWNVNGIRALLKGNGTPILKLAQRENFDVLCLQETKLQEKHVMETKEFVLPGYENSFWSCSTAKLGYSGTAVISRVKPLSVVYGLGIPNHDKEGRLITVEFDTFYLVAGYVPNSGQRLERLVYRTEEWDVSLSNLLKELEKNKPVILTGDLNCAHQEMDIFNPAGNRKSAGFTDEERASFEENFLKRGMVDTFRRQHPQAVAYTYWGHRFAARSSNKGWRLDYFLASDSISELVHDSYVLPDVGGSDHCPIGLVLRV